MESSTAVAGFEAHRQALVSAVVRFAGDSGDGMQLTGSQFALATAAAGNDLATFPDFPAEIRAPTGTTYGVSAFQINFGARTIRTSGDNVDVLVAMNPAALKVNIADVTPGGIVIADTGAFSKRNLRKAGYGADPLADGTMNGYRALTMDISRHTLEAVKKHDLSKAEALRCKNFWSLGLVYWMFGRDRAPTVDWLRAKFADRPDLADANIAALRRRSRLRRDGGAAGRDRRLRGATRGARSRPLPRRDRFRGDGLGSACRRPAQRAQAGVLLVPDHPGLGAPAFAGRPQGVRRGHLPGRGRDRRRLRRHRRVLRRLDRDHLDLGAGHGVEGPRPWGWPSPASCRWW